MSIVEHIGAGDYQRDIKGRWLVPTAKAGTAKVYAVYEGETPDVYVLAGFVGGVVQTWPADGSHGDATMVLQAPGP